MKNYRLDFNNDDEKNLIEQVFLNAIEALSEDDKRLPQVETLLPLLKKGIGIHHGGLLPILKEIIEILFQVFIFILIIIFNFKYFLIILQIKKKIIRKD